MNSKNTSFQSYSTPTTPIHNRFAKHLRVDLLQAADSLTSAMSSLVQQLNTEQTESFQTGNKFDFYPYDEEAFLASDDDDEKDDRAFNLSSIKQKIRNNRFFT